MWGDAMKFDHLNFSGKPIINSQTGFSLVEILVALTVFAVGMLAVATMQTSAMRGNQLASGLSEGLRSQNQDKVEELMALDYEHADLTPGNYGPESNPPYDTWYTVLQGLEGDAVANPDLKTVSVTTTWHDLSGDHSVTTAFIKHRTL